MRNPDTPTVRVSDYPQLRAISGTWGMQPRCPSLIVSQCFWASGSA